jgi:hypothetical protein
VYSRETGVLQWEEWLENGVWKQGKVQDWEGRDIDMSRPWVYTGRVTNPETGMVLPPSLPPLRRPLTVHYIVHCSKLNCPLHCAL